MEACPGSEQAAPAGWRAACACPRRPSAARPQRRAAARPPAAAPSPAAPACAGRLGGRGASLPSVRVEQEPRAPLACPNIPQGGAHACACGDACHAMPSGPLPPYFALTMASTQACSATHAVHGAQTSRTRATTPRHISSSTPASQGPAPLPRRSGAPRARPSAAPTARQRPPSPPRMRAAGQRPRPAEAPLPRCPPCRRACLPCQQAACPQTAASLRVVRQA